MPYVDEWNQVPSYRQEYDGKQSNYQSQQYQQNPYADVIPVKPPQTVEDIIKTPNVYKALEYEFYNTEIGKKLTEEQNSIMKQLSQQQQLQFLMFATQRTGYPSVTLEQYRAEQQIRNAGISSENSIIPVKENYIPPTQYESVTQQQNEKVAQPLSIEQPKFNNKQNKI